MFRYCWSSMVVSFTYLFNIIILSKKILKVKHWWCIYRTDFGSEIRFDRLCFGKKTLVIKTKYLAFSVSGWKRALLSINFCFVPSWKFYLMSVIAVFVPTQKQIYALERDNREVRNRFDKLRDEKRMTGENSFHICNRRQIRQSWNNCRQSLESQAMFSA